MLVWIGYIDLDWLVLVWIGFYWSRLVNISSRWIKYKKYWLMSVWIG